MRFLKGPFTAVFAGLLVLATNVQAENMMNGAGGSSVSVGTSRCCELRIDHSKDGRERGSKSSECRICPSRFGVSFGPKTSGDFDTERAECAALCAAYVPAGTHCSPLGIPAESRDKLADDDYCTREREMIRLAHELCDEIRFCESRRGHVIGSVEDNIALEQSFPERDAEVLDRLRKIVSYLSECPNAAPLTLNPACDEQLHSIERNAPRALSNTPLTTPRDASERGMLSSSVEKLQFYGITED